VLDGAVFSGGVHGLENEQESPAVLGVELFLHFAEQAHTSREDFLGVFFAFDAVGFGGGRSP